MRGVLYVPMFERACNEHILFNTATCKFLVAWLGSIHSHNIPLTNKAAGYKCIINIWNWSAPVRNLTWWFSDNVMWRRNPGGRIWRQREREMSCKLRLTLLLCLVQIIGLLWFTKKKKTHNRPELTGRVSLPFLSDVRLWGRGGGGVWREGGKQKEKTEFFFFLSESTRKAFDCKWFPL